MFSFLLATVTAFQDPSVAPESIRRHCAAVVGIPYASDNFTDKEWYEFVDCVRDHMNNSVDV